MDKKQKKVSKDQGSGEAGQDVEYLVKQMRSDFLFIEHLALVVEPLLSVDMFKPYLAVDSKMSQADMVKYVKSARAFAACVRSCPGLLDHMALYMAAYRDSGVLSKEPV